MFSTSAHLDGEGQVVEYRDLNLEQGRRLMELRVLAVRNNADGVILNGKMVGIGDPYMVIGPIFFDRKQRFFCGKVIHTSGIHSGAAGTMHLEGRTYVIDTRNSRYVVEFAEDQDLRLV